MPNLSNSCPIGNSCPRSLTWATKLVAWSFICLQLMPIYIYIWWVCNLTYPFENWEKSWDFVDLVPSVVSIREHFFSVHFAVALWVSSFGFCESQTLFCYLPFIGGNFLSVFGRGWKPEVEPHKFPMFFPLALFHILSQNAFWFGRVLNITFPLNVFHLILGWSILGTKWQWWWWALEGDSRRSLQGCRQTL